MKKSRIDGTNLIKFRSKQSDATLTDYSFYDIPTLGRILGCVDRIGSTVARLQSSGSLVSSSPSPFSLEWPKTLPGSTPSPSTLLASSSRYTSLHFLIIQFRFLWIYGVNVNSPSCVPGHQRRDPHGREAGGRRLRQGSFHRGSALGPREHGHRRVAAQDPL